MNTTNNAFTLKAAHRLEAAINTAISERVAKAGSFITLIDVSTTEPSSLIMSKSAPMLALMNEVEKLIEIRWEIRNRIGQVNASTGINAGMSFIGAQMQKQAALTQMIHGQNPSKSMSDGEGYTNEELQSVLEKWSYRKNTPEVSPYNTEVGRVPALFQGDVDTVNKKIKAFSKAVVEMKDNLAAQNADKKNQIVLQDSTIKFLSDLELL